MKSRSLQKHVRVSRETYARLAELARREGTYLARLVEEACVALIAGRVDRPGRRPHNGRAGPGRP
jgi:predicted DNA-binding protein